MILFTIHNFYNGAEQQTAGHKEKGVYVSLCVCMHVSLYMFTCLYIHSLVHKCMSNARQ